jgi:uncharacterized Zn-binding protein involved in type VI secretion
MLLAVAALASVPLASFAEDPANPCAPSTITSDGKGVVVEGKTAARAGNTTGCAGRTIMQGSPNVFINGKPAAVQGDKTGCGGSIVSGASGVFINGKPWRGWGTPQVAPAIETTMICPDFRRFAAICQNLQHGSVAFPRGCG